MTAQTARVLEAFLSGLGKEWYGLELMAVTGLRSGTVYPILHGLYREGWLHLTHEDIDPEAEGRPARRLYSLTSLGQREAAAALERRGRSRRSPASLPALRSRGAMA
jgi:DNA-binding PadR family transcriptional regulator